LYIPKELICFAHPTPKRPQHNPYKLFPKKYAEEAQDSLPIDDSRPMDSKEYKRLLDGYFSTQGLSTIRYYSGIECNCMSTSKSNTIDQETM
jgi:hypothetical protein